MSASSSSSSGRGGGSKKTRRKRSNISGEILQCLEKFYETTPHPDSHERRQLALELGETENLVRIWFQNRRAKRRRVRNQLLMQDISTTKPGEEEKEEEDYEEENTNNPEEEDRKLLSTKSVPKKRPSSSRSPARRILNSCGRNRKKSSSSRGENNGSSSSSSILFPSSEKNIQPEPQTSCQQPGGDVPLMLDVQLYPRILTRIIGMVAAGESILKESDADFYESLKDAHYGILLKDNKKLLYNKIYGLHVVDCS